MSVVTAAANNPVEIRNGANEGLITSDQTSPVGVISASKKRREPEGGFDREPTASNGRRKTNSSAEDELLRLAENHLKMIKEE